MRRVLLLPVALLLVACGARTGLEHTEAPLVVDHSLGGLSLGVKHTCVWFHDGTARCWGWNGQGQLGDGTRERRAIPTKVLELTDAVSIDLGAQHSCALESRGEVQCWGDRSNGQVGEGSPLTDFTVPSAITKPVDVVGLGRGSGVAQLALGEAHSCARYESGEVACWGSNVTGELGSGAREYSSVPLRVVGLHDATQIVLGASHACVLTRAGTVKCWGADDYSQLGAVPPARCGSIACARTPVDVPEFDSVVELAAAGGRTCARRTDGTVWCWGISAERTDNSPVQVRGLEGAVEIALGRAHACARKNDGSVWCWGSNGSGQLGYETTVPCPGGATITCGLVPRLVSALPPSTHVALGGDHSCALSRDGQLRCWGDNAQGQLGDGTTVDRLVPTIVPL